MLLDRDIKWAGATVPVHVGSSTRIELMPTLWG